MVKLSGKSKAVDTIEDLKNVEKQLLKVKSIWSILKKLVIFFYLIKIF